jgi:NAD(P)-dependent dehydrogenase (short-subunit alcohol dehydrogenase family)
VALVARGEEALAAAAREIGALAVPADTGSDDSVAAMVAAVAEAFGGIDILVNAAATPNQGGFSEDDLEAHLAIKVRGYLRTARAVVPHMDGWGRIVNVSGLAARSTGSVVGSVRNVAVSALTKNLADELGPQGINVTVVHPGTTRTERTASIVAARAAARGKSEAQVEADMASNNTIGRLVDATEIADIVAFLASPRSVAINGDAIACGGGIRGAIHY